MPKPVYLSVSWSVTMGISREKVDITWLLNDSVFSGVKALCLPPYNTAPFERPNAP